MAVGGRSTRFLLDDVGVPATKVSTLTNATEPRTTSAAPPWPWASDPFIAARIPGTGIHLGLSRRLYAACAALYLQQAEMPDTVAFADGPRLNDPGFGQDLDQDDDEAREQYARRARQAHYEQEQRYRTRVHEAVSTAFRLAEEHPEDSWLTGPVLPVRVDDLDKPLLLEAATAESYLALEPTDPVLSTAGRTA